MISLVEISKHSIYKRKAKKRKESTEISKYNTYTHTFLGNYNNIDFTLTINGYYVYMYASKTAL